MDMHDPYIAAVRAHVPDADLKIVFDKFHVMRLVNEAVDKVRRQENKELREQEIEILTGTKYLWLYAGENIPEHLLPCFDELRRMDLKVSRAWAIKETLRKLWDYVHEGWARRFFRRWYWWATHSQLAPMVTVAKTLKRHLDNILTYLSHRITNALNETINAQIEKVKRMECGFRNRENFHTAIYFHCGGLDLYPRRATTTSSATTFPTRIASRGVQTETASRSTSGATTTRSSTTSPSPTTERASSCSMRPTL